MNRLPPLHPAVADTRVAVRHALASLSADTGLPAGTGPPVLVGLSGGADSLALAAAVAFEAPRRGIRAGAIVVDHDLQPGSAGIAERAAEQARGLGLDPVLVRRVDVGSGAALLTRGPEAAARDARYAAFAEATRETGAAAILTAHTRDDQAEQVLLALARGSGTRSIAGIPRERRLGEHAGVVRADDGRVRENDDGDGDDAFVLRPFLAPGPGGQGITRAVTEAACAAQGLEPWQDPHNSDHGYARVRVRETVLPVLERELGPGVAESLSRTADLAREDADALDTWAERVVGEAVTRGDGSVAVGGGSVEAAVGVLAAQPTAILTRVIRAIATRGFGAQLGREHTAAVAVLVTDWRGQGPVFVPGIRVKRAGGHLVFERQIGSPRERQGPV